MVEEVHSSLSSGDAFQELLEKYAQSQRQLLVILGELQEVGTLLKSLEHAVLRIASSTASKFVVLQNRPKLA